MNLTLEERTKIFDKVCRLVETKHFDPSMNGVDWNALAKNRRDQILASAEPEDIREGSSESSSRAQNQPHRFPTCRNAKHPGAERHQCNHAAHRRERE